MELGRPMQPPWYRRHAEREAPSSWSI